MDVEKIKRGGGKRYTSFQYTPFELLKFACIILFMIALGMVIMNQYLSYKYKAQFLLQPCAFCAELHKNQSLCIEGCFTYEIEVITPLMKDLNWTRIQQIDATKD